ncbi:acyl-CoA thioesterase domain-containing protein [Actinomycetaceae bacterium MB13-C1-2]|nr:acyl-CoA thioesterase domain-containing protein [Actinomycetaceae bacterium MB13-C1-2]
MPRPIHVPEIDEEPVASVLRVLQLRKVPNSLNLADEYRTAIARGLIASETDINGSALDADSFEGDSLPQVRRIYGGQVIAQGLLSAAATVDDEARLPHSLHAYFLRGGNPDETLRFDVTRLRDGRSFSARSVTAWQDDREILTMTTSFQANEEGIESQVNHRDVPPPEEVDSALELFRTIDHPVSKFLGKTAAFDVRHVQKSLYVGAPAESTPSQQLWMKIRSAVPDGAPQVIHRALLAYVVDQVMLEPSLRSVGLYWSAPGMSLASIDHSMWFHRDVDINDWLLFSGESSSVSNSRAKSDVRIYTRGGRLVASASQEGMIRIPKDGERSSGHWTLNESR